MHLIPLLLLGWTWTSDTPQATHAFRNAECQVAFQTPADWLARPDSSEFAEVCSFVVQPISRDSLLLESDSVDLHTIFLQVIAEAPERAAALHGFERRGGNWLILGRWGAESPGATYARAGLRGVIGVASAGCYRLGGSYVGACDSPVALLGNDVRSVTVRGGPRSEDVVNLIASTLEVGDEAS